jgi:small-conductance mechanosensitive channel
MPFKLHAAVSHTRRRALLCGVVCVGLNCVLVLAQQQPASAPSTKPSAEITVGSQVIEIPPGNVTIDGHHVLTVYESVGSYSPEERARRITDRIVTLARDGRIPAETVRLQPRGAWTEILAEDTMLLAVTDLDAQVAGKPRAQLANEYAGNVRQAILIYRREHSWNSVLKGILYTLIATVLLALFAFAIRKLRIAVRLRFERWLAARSRAEKKSAFHIAVTYFGNLLLSLGTVSRWVLIIALFETYIAVTLRFFASTRAISLAMSEWLFSNLGSMGRAALEYLPNLLIISVIAVIASQLMRLIGLVSREIASGSLQIGGFYPDWAEPTAKLVRVLVLVLVIVVIFPYLPGSKSPAFQGISIFVGVLLSLGSSSAVANAIAGIILTYMRSFLVGDWVKIGDTTGEVVERNMLVTRVLTMKREIITIPNATVMSGAVMNFTAEAKKSGVIFHTTATIGYDAPWRTVHQLLIDAALATKNVLHDPAPFVLQTALNDFYVAYELNAYTDMPLKMQFTYSELHQNIQDRFNEAGVEICSPHFSALRDGNAIAIPRHYIPEDYTKPGFHLDEHRNTEEDKSAAKQVGR